MRPDTKDARCEERHKDAGLRKKQDMYSTATAYVYMKIYVTPETLIKMSVKRGAYAKQLIREKFLAEISCRKKF